MEGALQIVTPLKEEAAEPVHAVNMNARSFHNTPIECHKPQQNLSATFTAVVSPAPAGNAVTTAALRWGRRRAGRALKRTPPPCQPGPAWR